MNENIPTIHTGIMGCGDNLIRKIISSVEKTSGIEITALTDIYPTLQETMEHLKKRTNDDGSPMYQGKLINNMNNLLQMEKQKKIKYFQTKNKKVPEGFFSGIDAVHISTPNDSHGFYAIMCAEQKKHLLCEKPFVLSYAEAVYSLNMINRAKRPKNIAKISATHYLRYGPSQELIKNLEKILETSPPITNIFADFVEDRTYLNQRTREQFFQRGAIYDMVVHYVALVHKLGAVINTKANLNSGLGNTTTYKLPSYNNETAVLTVHGLTGPNFSPDAILQIKAVKGHTTNSKNLTIKLEDGRLIQLNYLPGMVGIYDSDVITGKAEKWWDDNEMKINPFERIYLELRDEVRRLDYGVNGGYQVTHNLEESIKDLAVLDKIKNSAIEHPYENYYCTV